jgi:hypothetical protein
MPRKPPRETPVERKLPRSLRLQNASADQAHPATQTEAQTQERINSTAPLTMHNRSADHLLYVSNPSQAFRIALTLIHCGSIGSANHSISAHFGGGC